MKTEEYVKEIWNNGYITYVSRASRPCDVPSQIVYFFVCYLSQIILTRK